MTSAQQALAQYARVNTVSSVEDASPHRLIQLLLDGALERIAVARRALESGQVAARGTAIGKTVDIVSALRSSLNFEAGGEVAANLEALYDYVERRLLQANLEASEAMLDECARLLHEVKEGWDGIGQAA
ncbi:flagellar export chaperone FliS [Plasticicumulans acidivorans]|uniref:Flagellar secretion chaperone FliS n=1 Tax=Plasticicumulans acidivorans TaxID=886464 RepID=A0A317MWP5_9GAMM|nr:flagellar export chaperone FliS [Plasticicumulans acidivorans]PWV63289.1 flagellar protein FliS [Plasticicumulans acidivorans]